MSRNNKIARLINYNLIHRYLIRIAKLLSEKQLLMVCGVIVGIVAAFAAYSFEWAVTEVRRFVTSLSGDASSLNILYLIMPIVGVILVTIFTKKVVKDNISHGVTRIFYAITYNRSNIKFHNVYSSIVAGATTIGFGGSVGPEAPIVMTGAAVGSNIARFFRANYRNTTVLLGCGVAAALAGIFKAPITGVIFVIEVLMIDITMLSIVPILISAVTAASIIYMLHGFDPVFSVNLTSESIAVSHMPFYIVLAMVCGLMSYYLIYTSSKIEARFKRVDKQYKKWLAGGVIIGLLVMLFPPLYGQGYNSITNLIDCNLDKLFSNTLLYPYRSEVWAVLLFSALIMLLKSIAMACTNAAGGVGGAFAPSLFLGAFTGFFVANSLNAIFGLNLPVLSFVLVGMAGVMSGAMDSPLTAVFLIAEITGGYRLFLPLMLVSAVSFAISYYFSPYSVYTRELAIKGDIWALSKERSMLFVEVENLIENDFSIVYGEMGLGQFVRIVSRTHRNIFPVLNEDKEIEGVVSLDSIRKDMFSITLYDKNTVYDYMDEVKDVIVIGEPISSVLDKFDKCGAWNLPVVSEEKRYLGFISRSKIFSEYRNELLKQ